jgi:hypothetical protein
MEMFYMTVEGYVLRETVVPEFVLKAQKYSVKASENR